MKPTILVILDGIGIRDEIHGNAFKQASTPNIDFLMKEYGYSLLDASGRAVGLLDGQMGNSEVGHSNIGAGRVVYQASQLINEKISNGEFFKNEEILSAINHVNENDSKLHIMGLLSDSGVHSLFGHFLAILKLAKSKDIKKLYFHVITDGRDTLPKCTMEYISLLEENLMKTGLGEIATVSGRYYTMDRDNNWDRVKKGYDAIVHGVGEKFDSPKELVNYNYNKDITDEFIIPGIINSEGTIDDNDSIIWCNFRSDRAREILTAITNHEFCEFETKKLNNIKLVTMMPIADTAIYKNAFKLDELKNTLGDYLANKGFTQLRIAETEKYSHVTFFFDGGEEKKLRRCERILIPSPKVATYDLKPEMSCTEITDRLLSEIDKYDVIILNYANGDMVGHTGVMDAAIKAVETVDYNLGRLYKKCKELYINMLITADHGNCEEMLDDDNNVLTAHSLNKVPFIVCDKKYKVKDGKLGDIAPTLLKVMGVEIPKEMTGNILVE